MSSLQQRISKLREQHLDAVAAFRQAGLSRERVAEVVDADGADWRALTDEELRAIAPDPDAEVVEGCGRSWGDLSDRELERIGAGEEPHRVV